MFEEELFAMGRNVYYLGLSNLLDAITHTFTDAGLILITTILNLDNYEYNTATPWRG